VNREDVKRAKASILRCLTVDFEYGRRKDGAPLKRPRRNQHIFDAKRGFAAYNGTDLEMVMDKVVLGLYFAMADSVEPEALPESRS